LLLRADRQMEVNVVTRPAATFGQYVPESDADGEALDVEVAGAGAPVAAASVPFPADDGGWGTRGAQNALILCVILCVDPVEGPFDGCVHLATAAKAHCVRFGMLGNCIRGAAGMDGDDAPQGGLSGIVGRPLLTAGPGGGSRACPRWAGTWLLDGSSSPPRITGGRRP